MRDEAQREQNQVIEAATSEVTAANQQVQHQVAVRKRLEESMRELERKVEAEWQNQTGTWEEQTKNLLDSIQKECNLAFDRNKTASTTASTAASTNTSSPRTVLDEFSDDEKRFERDQFQSSWSTSMLHPSPSPAMSPEVGSSPLSYNMSELDRALAETEAIVRSLVSSDYEYKERA
jgi:hypothetical protein